MIVTNKYPFFTIVLFLFVQFNNAYLTTVRNNEYFLDSQSKCITSCGSESSPFRTFNESISFLSKSGATKATLFVSPGEYIGEMNKDININIDLDIIAQLGSKDTIIDCQGTGYGFKAFGASNVMIKGLSIKNCVAGFGGAVNSNNLFLTLDDIVFIENSARQGSAIYSTSGMTSISYCSFIRNKGTPNTNAVYVKNGFAIFDSLKFFINSNDVGCSNSSIITSEGAVFGSTCASDCQILDQNREAYCGKEKSMLECNEDGQCDRDIENNVNCPLDCAQESQVCNNDHNCDSPIENVSNCPGDCTGAKVLHPGWVLEYYNVLYPKPLGSFVNTPIIQKIEYIDLPNIVDFMGKYYAPVSGRLSAQIMVSTTTEYTFKLDLKNLAAIVLINGRVLFDNYFQQDMPTMVLERSILLSSRLPYTVKIYFTAVNDHQRDVSFYWKSDSKPDYTLVPSYYITADTTSTCGDGICNETPKSCLIDCYDQIEKECPAQSPPSNLQPFYGPVKDTLGQLINNQYIFSLPGVNYLSHGIDIFTGETLPSPVFAHTYCDNSSFTVVHAPYRGLVYAVPPSLSAQISTKCTMDTDTKTFSSSSQMAQEMSEASSMDISVHGSYGSFFYKVSIDASLSMSESVKKASEMEQKTNGQIFLTQLMCESSKVHVLEPFKFHPKFIKEFASAYDPDYSVSVTKMQHTIKTYGSMYYKSATLGGKLEQVSVVDSNYYRTRSSQDLEKAMDTSFSISASSKILPIRASASMSSSRDSKTSQEQQNEFEIKSKRSTLSVYGGKPGSYGSDDVNALSTWANTVDMIPFPIDYQAGFIRDIIPEDWYLQSNTSHSISAQQLWIDAEFGVLKEYLIANPIKSRYLDVDTLTLLNYTETVYLVASDCDLSLVSNVTIVDLLGNTTTSPMLTSNGFKIFITTLSDQVGLDTIKLLDSNANVVQCSATTNVTVRNLFTSREYNFVYDSTLNLFTEYHVTPNIITCQFFDIKTNITRVDPNSVGPVLVGVYINAEFKSVYAHINEPHTDLLVFDTKEYIGNVYSTIVEVIQGEHWMSLPNHYSTTDISVDFAKVVVTQTCPKGQSDCLPKNTEPTERGYKKVYENWQEEFKTMALAPVFVVLEPLGN
ncbi:hypothetical protein CYY_009582 [Polysphondylium violaceum]|uniref:MACPF domain-containing protein n=1 Tax=Polysphondylium violaceum TaxID=133409 RepID=A0A8J4PLC5_9MYCE|nr:hypothetical protein CYY_009582 [Polysphondylium violaceum]